MNQGKKAILIGATGLIGRQLHAMLLRDDSYSSVTVFCRSRINLLHPKLAYVQTDFKNLDLLRSQMVCDDLFCCIGTTKKKARTMEAYRYVDYEIPVQLARAAKENGATGVYCISSIGADSTSSSFYLKLKGEMEEAIRNLGFRKTALLRPSLLLGKREEKRFLEDLAQRLFSIGQYFCLGRLRNYRPIKASTVAKAMIAIARSDYKETIFENYRLKEIAEEKI